MFPVHQTHVEFHCMTLVVDHFTFLYSTSCHTQYIINDLGTGSPEARHDYIVALEELWHEPHDLLIDYNNQVPRLILDQKYLMPYCPQGIVVR